MPKALLIIDYTNDFVALNGALSAKEPAIALENTIVTLADKFLNNNDYVILPTDLHSPNDTFNPENKLFPAHNLPQTWGRTLFGKLDPWFQNNQTSNHVWQFAKNRYSSFTNTNLDNYLRERQITEIHLVGVVTDICVLHTAIDAYNLNYKVTIYANGVASFDTAGHAWALNHFKTALGFNVINSD